MYMPPALKTALIDSDAHVMIGPRSGARDAEMSIPVPLPPALSGLDVTVVCCESLRSDMPRPIAGGGNVCHYSEVLKGEANIRVCTEDGAPIWMGQGNLSYLGAWLDQTGWKAVIAELCKTAALEVLNLPDGLRLRDCGNERFWFNYGTESVTAHSVTVPAAGVLRQNRAAVT